jgi:hypothetical protein
MSSYRSRLMDALLVLKDAKLEKASGYATLWDGATGTRVTAAGKLDTGGGFFKGALVLDISDIGAEGDEVPVHTAGKKVFSIQLRGCKTSTFATREVILAQWNAAGGYTQTTGTCLFPTGTNITWHGYLGINGSSAMRVIRPFVNEVGDHTYRYLRLYHAFKGTWGTGINYSALISKD